MDRASRPATISTTYANGTWAKTTAIPADKSNYGMFTVLDDLSRQRTRDILDEAQGHPTSKIGNAYASFLDEAAVEAKGLGADPALARRDQGGCRARPAMPRCSPRPTATASAIPFGGYVGQDDKNPEIYIVHGLQGGLGMPDRDYYLQTDPKLAEARGRLSPHLDKMLTLAGEPNAAARARRSRVRNQRSPRSHWTRIDSRDATKTYNKMTRRRARKPGARLRFRRLFSGASAPTSSERHRRPAERLQGHRRSWSPRRRWRCSRTSCWSARSTAMRAVSVRARSTRRISPSTAPSCRGTPEQEARWKRAVDFVTDATGRESARSMSRDISRPRPRRRPTSWSRTSSRAMDRRIDSSTWMAPETKVEGACQARRLHAQDRLSRPLARLFRRSRSSAATCSAMRCARASSTMNHNVGKLGKPIYRWEWGMTPMTINAYANFGMDEIVFPAAILQPPFFDPQCRSGGQLWRHRRGDRPRDQPSFRRSGRQI